MNTLYGYTGKYLIIDLSSQKIYKEQTDHNLMRKYLGGSGICAKILWDEARCLKDAFSPENRLIFASGPLTGTYWPSSGRTVVAGISPLTGLYGDSNSGGAFAPALKLAGYDYLVIKGRASTPKYLWIKDDHVELREAGDIWFNGNFKTHGKIKKIHNYSNIQIASIGTAGANKVRFSSIFFTGERSAARCGLGAVMGSKNLKAIAVASSKNKPKATLAKKLLLSAIGQKKYLQPLKSIAHLTEHLNFWDLLAKPAEFTWFALKIRKKIISNPATRELRNAGTPMLVSPMNKAGRMPTMNFQQGNFKNADNINKKALSPFVKQKYLGCYGCPIMCAKKYKVNDIETSCLEYETICSLGSKCGNSDIRSIIEGNQVCNDLGMDTISAGGVIAFLMELNQRGMLSDEFAEDLSGGEPIEWGNEKFILTVLKKIAKREGKADILAEGVKRLADYFPPETVPYAMHVKNMEISGQDGRAQKSMALAHAVASRGADHLKGFPTVDELDYSTPIGDPDFIKNRFGKKLKGIENRLSYEHKAFLVKDGEDFCSIIDSVGICKFGTMFPPILYWDDLVHGLKLATGIDYSVKDLQTTGERICNLQRAINLSNGLQVSDDTLPERFIKEGSPSPGALGERVDIKRMLFDYYKLRGWDNKTGRPFDRTLKKLGIGQVAEELDKIKGQY